MLCKFEKDNPLERCFLYANCPLIKVGNDMNYYNTRAEKYNALRDRNPDDKFIIAWLGEFKTCVFELSEKDIKQVLDRCNYFKAIGQWSRVGAYEFENHK